MIINCVVDGSILYDINDIHYAAGCLNTILFRSSVMQSTCCVHLFVISYNFIQLKLITLTQSNAAY
jgi:hypothetical protein